MRILFCAYRDWALEIFNDLRASSDDIVLAKTPEDLSDLTVSGKWDVIMVVGWSWKVESSLVRDQLVIGVHPSDLPDYAGGSPIQNQILDGIKSTQATLFKLNEKFDEGDIIDKEPIDLSGHLDQVFESISSASRSLIKRFIEKYPENSYIKQGVSTKKVRRLKPSDSELPLPVFPEGSKFYKDGKPMTCEELWNFIRCREDPYPNVYLEDSTGRLVIKHVEFEAKTSTDS